MINLNRIITGLMESRTWCSLAQCGQQITHNQDMNSSVIRSHHFYLKILCKMNRGKLIKMELCWGVGISIWVRMIILHRFRGWRKKLGNNTKRIIRWVSIICSPPKGTFQSHWAKENKVAMVVNPRLCRCLKINWRVRNKGWKKNIAEFIGFRVIKKRIFKQISSLWKTLRCILVGLGIAMIWLLKTGLHPSTLKKKSSTRKTWKR